MRLSTRFVNLLTYRNSYYLYCFPRHFHISSCAKSRKSSTIRP